jgi:hypothetical protein
VTEPARPDGVATPEPGGPQDAPSAEPSGPDDVASAEPGAAGNEDEDEAGSEDEDEARRRFEEDLEIREEVAPAGTGPLPPGATHERDEEGDREVRRRRFTIG